MAFTFLAPLLFLLICAAPPAALAQSPYVAAIVGADVFRSAESEVNGVEAPNGNGEVFGAGLRLGTSLGDRWGIELDYVRPGKLEHDNGPSPFVRALAGGGALAGFDPFGATAPIIIGARSRTSVRSTTLSTTAWIGQRVSGPVELAYVGGLSFSRVTQEVEYNLGQPRPLVPLLPQRLQRVRNTRYGIGPVVGMEARIALTDHLRLVPGLRLHSLGGDMPQAWLIRPAVGIGWVF